MKMKIQVDFIKVLRDADIAWVSVDATADCDGRNLSITATVPVTDLSLNPGQMATEAKKIAAEYVAAFADVLKVDTGIN